MSLEEFIEAQQSLDGLIKHLANKYTEKFEKLNLFGKEFIADEGSFGALDDIDFDDRHLLFPEEFLKPGPGSPVPDLWVDDFKVVYDIDVRDISQVLREDLRLLVNLVTEDVFVGDTDVLEKTIVQGFRIDIVDSQSAAGTITGFGYTRTTDKPMLVIEMNPILGPEDNFLLQQGNFLINSYIEEFYPQNRSTRLAVLKGEIPLINTQEGNYEKKIDMLKFHTTENPSIGPKQKADMLKMLEISKNEELELAADIPAPSQIDRATNLIDIEDTLEGVASDIVPDDISSIDTPTNVVDERLRLEKIIKNDIQTPLLKEGLLKRYLDYDEFIKGLPANRAEQLLDYTNKDVADKLELFKDQYNLKKPYGPGELEDINSILLDWEEPSPIEDAVLADIEDWDLDAEGKPIDPRKKSEGMSKFKQELSAQYNYLLSQDPPDRPFGPGAAHIDEILNANTQFVNNLPLSTTVKNQFNKLVQGRAKNLATPGGVADAVDVWELGVLGLMIAAIAYKEYDEIPTILTNKAVDMFNSMTSSYGIPPVSKEEYDLDYKFINKVVETGEKFMPTDIIIKKVGDVVKGAAETGAVTGFGYVSPNLTKADTMETTQKIQPGVQEEKMFEQAKPKKRKPTGGAGAKIL